MVEILIKPMNKPKDQSAILEALERFDDTFVVIDDSSDPDEECEDFSPEFYPKDIKKWISKELSLAEQRGREKAIGEIDNIMDSEKAKDIADQLEAFHGQRSCKVCGFDPEHQRQYILNKLKKGNQTLDK